MLRFEESKTKHQKNAIRITIRYALRAIWFLYTRKNSFEMYLSRIGGIWILLWWLYSLLALLGHGWKAKDMVKSIILTLSAQSTLTHISVWIAVYIYRFFFTGSRKRWKPYDKRDSCVKSEITNEPNSVTKNFHRTTIKRFFFLFLFCACMFFFFLGKL